MTKNPRNLKNVNLINNLEITYKIIEFEKGKNLENYFSVQEKKKAIYDWHVALGHIGFKRLIKSIRLAVPFIKWPDSLVKDVLRLCPICLKNKREIPSTSISPRYFPKTPMEVVSIDHFSFSKLRDERGYVTTLSIKSEMSKHITSVPCRTYNHSEICNYLSMYQICFGRIVKLVADNAISSFELEKYCEMYGITLANSLAWDPCSNGVVECQHKWLRAVLPVLVIEMKLPANKWVDALMPACEIYNNSIHSSTLYAPNQLMIGVLSDEFYGNVKSDKLVKEMWKEASENNEKAILSRIKLPTFHQSGSKIWEPGTRVIIHPNRGKKLFGTVLHDSGTSCKIIKDGNHTRFQTILYKKSKLTKIPEGVDESSILLN